MADVPLLASESKAAPLDYLVPGAQEIIPKSITASFDGSGAGGSFVPTLVILAPNGAVLAACPMNTAVAAGVSVDVSWFPRVGASTIGVGNGLQFAGPSPVYGPVNIGDSLDVETTGADGMTWKMSSPGNNGWNVTVNDTTGGGIFETNHTNNPTRILNTDSGDIVLHQSGTGAFAVSADGGTGDVTSAGILTLQSSGANTALLALNGEIDVIAAFPIIIGALGGTTEAVIQARIFTHGNYFSVLDNTPIEAMRVTPQAVIMFALNDKTGARIFEVHDDGSLHGKTGQALTFDL